MERLDIAMAPERANIEAAIHFARYAIAKDMVQGKRVLDIACGEGYGSYLLKQAGATSVVGVDISAESVARAQKSFGVDGLEYLVLDVKDIRNSFAENSFDLIISIETIEHVEDPADYLEGLKYLSAPGGVLVVSCPNDHWYYPSAEQSNPYHRRKYRFDEFQKLSVPILGENVQWSIGTGVFGFASTPLNPEVSYEKVPNTWMSFNELSGAYLVHGESDFAVGAEQSSYFVGVWNAPGPMLGAAVYPLAMDMYEGVAQAQYGLNWFESIRSELERSVAKATEELERCQDNLLKTQEEFHRSHAEIQELKKTVEEAQGIQAELHMAKRDLRRTGLMLHATQAENETILHAMREESHRYRTMQAECENYRVQQAAQENTIRDLHVEKDRYRVGYERYIRLRRVLPAGLRSWLVKAVKSMRGRGDR